MSPSGRASSDEPIGFPLNVACPVCHVAEGARCRRGAHTVAPPRSHRRRGDLAMAAFASLFSRCLVAILRQLAAHGIDAYRLTAEEVHTVDGREWPLGIIEVTDEQGGYLLWLEPPDEPADRALARQ